MKKNSLGFILGLSLMIPAASHFAYGIILAVEFIILFFAWLLCKYILDILNIDQFIRPISYAALIMTATWYMLIVKILSPIANMAIGVYIFMPVFSYILALSIFEYEHDFENIAPAVTYSGLLLGLSLVREVNAFGTISLPAINGLFYIPIIPQNIEPPFRFFGTNAGAFILLGIGMWLYMCIQKSEFLPLRSKL